MKRTWVRFEAVMKQGSEGEMAALPPGNPDGEKKEVRERLKEALNCAVVNPKVKSIIKQGIPPVHAGKTGTAYRHEPPAVDHPRACGENAYPSR